MAVLFGLKPDKMETIEPASVDPHLEDKFKTTVAKTREETMEHEKHDNADFRVYTDGSGNNEEVGAAAVMYKKGRLTPIDQRQCYIGPRKEHNTYEAEDIGGILGTWLLAGH